MKKKFFKSLSNEEDCDENMNRTKFIHNRIKVVEKYLPELEKTLFEYIDKNAKIRDCCDKVAKVLENYAKIENVTTDFKSQISDFSNILLDVGTCRDAQVQTMETKVLEELNEYSKLCKFVQGQLKMSLVAYEKEKSCMRQLKKIKDSEPLDQSQISLAEAELLKAKGESLRSVKNLEEQIDMFEKKRITVIKEALLSWTLAELHLHTKALQLFTDAYRLVADIDVNSNIEEFRNKLHSACVLPQQDFFERSESLLQLISFPFQKSKIIGGGIPHPSSSFSSASSESTTVSIY